MKIIWDMVDIACRIDGFAEGVDENGKEYTVNCLEFFEDSLRYVVRGRTHVPENGYFLSLAVDCYANIFFNTLLPVDLLFIVYLYLTFQWHKANKVRKAYKVFLLINRYRLVASELYSAIWYFQTEINKEEKKHVNEDSENTQ